MKALPGGGRYDDELRAVMQSTGADAVVFIVFGGNRGDGFGVVTTDPTFAKHIPRTLRDMAQAIEDGLKDVKDN